MALTKLLIKREPIFLNAIRFFSQECNRKQHKVVFVRHGESTWNQKNLFCGWYDAPLSERGKDEAIAAGKILKEAGYHFDIAFTSFLSRAQQTLCPILGMIDQMQLPVVKTWRLNERHYGALTGLDKSETAEKYGEEQVAIWRRSYDQPPPEMDKYHPYYHKIVYDPRYEGHLPTLEIPRYESLKDTISRALPFWRNTIVPQIRAGRNVLVVAHGNSLRGIVKYLDKISDNDIVHLNLPTGIPFVYTLSSDMIPTKKMEFLGDRDRVKAAMLSVAKQGRRKQQ